MMKKMLSKTKLVALACICMMLSVLLFVGDIGETKAEDSTNVTFIATETDYNYELAEITGAAIKDYKNASTYPTVDGYLFAGWFEEEECTESTAISDVSTINDSTTYYAKFMPEEVLSIKAQISTEAGSIIVDDVETETRNIRFVSSVDDLAYNKVGFKLVIAPDSETPTTKYTNSKTVYERIASKTTGDEFSFSSKVVDTYSEYFTTAIWKDVVDFNTKFYVQAYWKTLDGTVVYGPGRYVCINDGLNTNTVILPVKDTEKTLRVYDEENETTYEVTYGTSGTATAKVMYHDGEYAYLVIDLGTIERSDLQSVTTFTVEGLSAKYRNLYTTYTEDEEAGTDTTDTSWYTEYVEDGTVTEDGFVIATVADLYGFANLVTKSKIPFSDCKVYLVSDIVVNKGKAGTSSWTPDTYTDADGVEQTEPKYYWNDIGSSACLFNGTFDGQMHTISGINYDVSKSDFDSGSHFHGFFGQTGTKAKIKNFQLVNSVFTFGAKQSCGSIVGYAQSGTIENVYSEANVYSTVNHLAGMVGRSGSGFTMTNCWFDGNVKVGNTATEVFVGGLIANCGGVTMQNCKNTGTIDCSSRNTIDGGWIGGLVARVNGTVKISNCLSTGTMTLGTSTGVEDIARNKCGAVAGAVNGSNSLTCTNVFAMKDSFSQKVDDNTLSASAAVNGADQPGVTMISKNALNGVAAYANTTGLGYYTDNADGAWVIGTDLNPVPKTLADEWIDIKWFWDEVKDVDSDGEYTSSDIVADSKYEFTISDADAFYGLPVIAATYNFATDTISLANDIELNSGKATDWAAGYIAGARKWTAIGSDSKPFAGTFDGAGHEISGVCFVTSAQRQGLFALTTSGATIQNFKLVNSYFKSTNNALGSVVGRASGGELYNIYSNAIVECEGADVVTGFTGGIIGQIHANTEPVIVDNCWFAGSVTNNKDHVGGVIGRINAPAEITNCLNTGEVSSSAESTSYVGGLIGSIGNNEKCSATIECCLDIGNANYLGGADKEASITYTYTTTDEDMKGVAALTNMPDLFKYQEDGKYTGYWAMTSDGAPVLETFAEYAGKTYMGVDLSWYDGAGNYSLADAADFYGLALLSQTHKFEGEKITLSDDITINEGDSDDWYKKAPDFGWLSIGTDDYEVYFAGEFDGNGKTISGIYLSTTDQRKGLFGTTSGATIKNFKLVNSYFCSTYQYLGSVVGRADNSTLENIYSKADVSAAGMGIGGLVGHTRGTSKVTINNCWFAGTVECTNTNSEQRVGGIIGQGQVTMTHCLNTGTVTSMYHNGEGPIVGGLIGLVVGTSSIDHCLNAGNVKYVTATESFGFGSLTGGLNTDADGNTNATCTIDNSYALEGTCVDISNNTTVLGVGTIGVNTKVASSSDEMTALTSSENWVEGLGSYPVLKYFENLASSGDAESTSLLKMAIKNCQSGTAIQADVSEPILESNAVAITEGYHQGGCTDGKYFYQAHITYKDSENEDNNKVIILKYDMKTGKLVKQSGELSLNHANDVTYNSRMGYLVVCHSVGEPRQITLIDADTLVEIKKITLPMAIRGIDYNATRNCYAVAWEKTTDTDAVEHCISILDSNFEKIVDYDVSTNPTLLSSATVPQGMSSDDDYLYFLYYNQSTFQHVITVFDWEGNYQTEIEFTMSDMEPENISVVEGEIYCLAKRKVYQVIVK